MSISFPLPPDGNGNTIQEMFQNSTEEESLALGKYRLDPEKPFGQTMTILVQLVYKGVSTDMPLQLTPEERGVFCGSVIHTMSRLISKKESTWSKERSQFSRYTDMLIKLREDTINLLYTYHGARVPISIHCRSVEEADEIWAKYNSGELEADMKKYFSNIYLPLGPLATTVKIYDYEECKKKFQFSGFRLLYLLYPDLNKKR